MRNINENLNLAKIEPTSPAAKQAKSLNLQYVGFGRYVDPKTQQVTHIVQNDKLVPFNKAVKSNTFQTQNADDYGNFNNAMLPIVQQTHKDLTKAYGPEKYDDRELDAIYYFTSTGYYDINNRLSSLPAGVPANKIEKTSPDDNMPEVIASLDSAIKKIRIPQDVTVYTKLSGDIDINSLQPGMSFKFKGFRDTTTNLGSILANSSQQTGQSGRNQIAILQITVKKNSKGMYAADFSPNADDCEFILPRGAKIQIIGGPSNLVGSDAMSGSMNLEVLYFDCQAKT
jgi:hypothetical protein